MDTALFFKRNIRADYLHCYQSEEWTLDYFDIEVEKILPFIGYSFKANPVLIRDACELEQLLARRTVKKAYAIDSAHPLQRVALSPTQPPYLRIGVAYDCYP